MSNHTRLSWPSERPNREANLKISLSYRNQNLFMLTARWARRAQVCFTQLPWGSGGRGSSDQGHSLVLAHIRHTEGKQNCERVHRHELLPSHWQTQAHGWAPSARAQKDMPSAMTLGPEGRVESHTGWGRWVENWERWPCIRGDIRSGDKCQGKCALCWLGGCLSPPPPPICHPRPGQADPLLTLTHVDF